MTNIQEAIFKVLNWNIPLYVFLIIFIIVAMLCLSLLLFLILKKSKRVHNEFGTVDEKEIKRLERFEKDRNSFEMEVAKIKKVMRKK